MGDPASAITRENPPALAASLAARWVVLDRGRSPWTSATFLRAVTKAYQAPVLILAIHLDAALQETSEDLQVRGAVKRKAGRAEYTAAGAQMGADPQRQHELVGQVLADRHADRHVFLGLAQGFFGHVLGADAQPAESGEDLGDVLSFHLDHHHVARPTGGHAVPERRPPS